MQYSIEPLRELTDHSVRRRDGDAIAVLRGSAHPLSDRERGVVNGTLEGTDIVLTWVLRPNLA